MKEAHPRSSTRSARLIRPSTLLTLLVVIASILVALFPSERLLRDLAGQRTSDTLSIAYLQLLLRTHPNDPAIRYALGRNLASLGKSDEARRIFQSILTLPGIDNVEAHLALIEIDWSILAGLSANNQRRGQIVASLASQIAQLKNNQLRPVTLVRLVEISEAIGRPGLAAVLYLKLAQHDSDKRLFWKDKAAAAFLASGTPLQAAETFRDIFSDNKSDPALQRKYGLLALKTFVSANEAKAALDFADTAIVVLGSDREFMQQCVTIALSQNDLVRAQSWGRKLVAIAPNDPLLLTHQIDIELAAKDLLTALSFSRQLVALAPDTARRFQLARIAEWTGQHAIALEQWVFLARQNPMGEQMERALALAAALEDDKLWLELAGKGASNRLLGADEESAVIAIAHRKKVPQLLIGFLETYFERHEEGQRTLWKVLAETQEQQGEVDSALATTERVSPRYIGAVDAAVYQATMLVRAKRTEDALARLRSVHTQAAISDVDFWNLFGDTAWEQKNSVEARLAYRIAWESKTAPPLVADRLIESYNATSQPVPAIAVAREAYLRFSEPRWLILAMDSASRGARWDDLRNLVSDARKQEDRFQNLELYWLLRAHIASHDGEKNTARSAYQKAMSLNPESVTTRVTLLWFEINGGDRQHLGRYLQQWQNAAQTEPAYWEVYATGMLHLNRVDEALPWFQRRAQQQPDDHLWSLRYADALTKAGNLEQGTRLRHNVFTTLRQKNTPAESRPLVTKPLLMAYAKLSREFEGAPASDLILQEALDRGYDDKDVYEALVSSALSQQHIQAAHRWLVLANARQHRLPAWQSLAVALAQNDKPAIDHLLADTDARETLSVSDRIVALRRLGRNAAALAFAEEMSLREENAGNKLLSQQKEQLTRLQAKYAEAIFESKRLAFLQIQQFDVRGSAPTRYGRTTVKLRQSRLSSTGTELNLAGIGNENDLSVIVEIPLDDDLLRASLGTNQRSDRSLVYGRFEWVRRLDKGIATRLELSLNGIGEETAAMRAIGKKDRLSAAISADLSDAKYLRAEIAGQRYRTRNGNNLGSGYKIESEFGKTLFKANPVWQVRVVGSWEKNRLQDRLPSDLLGNVLPLSATVGDVVPERYGLLGIGSTLRFGDPDGEQGHYYSVIDALIGRQWPAREQAVSLRFSIGFPMSKPDSFRLEAFYTTAQGALAGQASRGIQVLYRHVF